MSGFRATIILLLHAFLLWTPIAGQEKLTDPFVVIQVGSDVSDVQLVDTVNSQTVGGISGDPNFDTNVQPVFEILSRTFLSEKTCLGFVADSRLQTCRLGFGLRFAGGHRRLNGQWFPLESHPGSEVIFNYSTTQVSAELLLGLLSSAVPVVAVGYKAGNNNYDLQVVSGDRLLVSQIDENNIYQSTTFYVDLGVLLNLIVVPEGSDFGFPDVVFSVEQTLPGKNVISVPDINGTGNREVDLRVRTARISLLFAF